MTDENVPVDVSGKSNAALFMSLIAIVLIIVVIFVLRGKADDENLESANSANNSVTMDGNDKGMINSEDIGNSDMPSSNESNVEVNVTSPTPPLPIVSEDGTTTVTVIAENFKFTPSEIKVKKGDKVRIVFNNKSGNHDFVLDEFNVKTKQTNGPSTETVEFTADKTGTFEYYCSVMQHRQMGMKGNLIVQ